MTKVLIHLTLWSNQPNIYSYLKSDCMPFHVICPLPPPPPPPPPAPPSPLRASTCGITFRLIFKNRSRAKFISGRSLLHLNTSSVLIYPYHAGHFTFESSLENVKLNGQQTHSTGNREVLVIMTITPRDLDLPHTQGSWSPPVPGSGDSSVVRVPDSCTLNAPKQQQFHMAPAMSALQVHHFSGYSKMPDRRELQKSGRERTMTETNKIVASVDRTWQMAPVTAEFKID